MPTPETWTRTRALSSEIDAAFEAYRDEGSEGEDRLYKAFRAQAENVVWYKLQSSDAAIAHDIAADAMRALKGFKGQSRLSTWFFRIAQNMAKDALKAKIKARERFVHIDPEHPDGLTQARPARSEVEE